jgi:hypothetical protein
LTGIEEMVSEGFVAEGMGEERGIRSAERASRVVVATDGS